MVPKFNLSLFLGGCKYPGFEAWHSHVWHGCGNMLMRQWIFRLEMKSTKLAKTLMEISGWNPFVDISWYFHSVDSPQRPKNGYYPVISSHSSSQRLESRNPSLEIPHDVRHDFASRVDPEGWIRFLPPDPWWWKTSFSMNKSPVFWMKELEGQKKANPLWIQTQPDIKLKW